MTHELTHGHRGSAMALAAIVSWLAQSATWPGMVDWSVPPAFAQEQKRPALSPSGTAAPQVQVSAELTANLHRLGNRRVNGEIFDLFSSGLAPRTPGRAMGKTTTKAKGIELGSPGSSDGKDADVPDTESEKDLTAPVNVLPPVASAPAPAPTPTVIAPPAVRQIPPAPVAHTVVAAPPPPPAPPAPKPPPLAFTYMGKLEDDGRSVYFLVKGDKLYTVKAGEDIDETYSFEGEFGNQLRLTYKPLHIAQLLTIGP